MREREIGLAAAVSAALVMAAVLTGFASILDALNRPHMPFGFDLGARAVAVTRTNISHVEIALRTDRIVRCPVAVRDALAG